MRKFRNILLFACALLVMQSAAAQTPDAFRRRLAEPAVDEESGREARVTVTETDDAARTVAAAAAGSRRSDRFQGYRLGIYSDNGQDAHGSSLAAKSTFEANFPGINVYWVYDNPYFKVTAGDCLTEEEAVMLLERVRSLFPKAYIVRAEMTAANIVQPEVAESNESTAAAEE